MTIDNSDLDAAKAAVQRSLDIFATNQKTLYTFENARINPPDVHQREFDRLLAPVTAAVDKAVAVADKVVSEVEKSRLSQFADPLAALDFAQMGLAGQYAPFVKEDCQNMDVRDLVGRLEWAGKYPSEYMKVLYRRYGAQRLREMANAKPQKDGIAEVRQALEALGAIGASRGLSSEQQRRLEAAAALKRWATWQLGIARDPEKDKADKAKSAAATRALF